MIKHWIDPRVNLGSTIACSPMHFCMPMFLIFIDSFPICFSKANLPSCAWNPTYGSTFKENIWQGGRYKNDREIGRGDQFLPHKFIKRSFECWATLQNNFWKLAEDTTTQKVSPISSKGGRTKDKRQKQRTKDLGMETCPGEGVMKKEKFPHSRKPLTGVFVGSFGITEGNIIVREKHKNKPQNMCVIEAASREVAQMLTSTTRKWGLSREVWVAWLVLRVGTGLESPEDNLKELMWDSNPNSGIARETKKIKKSKRPLLQKALMHHSDPWCTLPRGRETGRQQLKTEGKGPLQSWLQRHQTLSSFPVANHIFLETLDWWHLPGVSQPEISSTG